MAWVFLVTASFLTSRSVKRAANQRNDGVNERLERWAYGRSELRHRHRRHLLDLNPFLWLVQRERWKVYYCWGFLLVLLFTWFWARHTHGAIMLDTSIAFVAVLLVLTFLKVWIAAEACNRLAEDRRSGALELLLSTPLSIRQILQGQWLALARQFLLPSLVLAGLVAILLSRAADEGSQWGVRLSSLKIGTTLTLLFADGVALGWLGMWLGLDRQNTGRALVAAISRIFFLPLAVYYLIYYLSFAFFRPRRWRPHPLDGDAGVWLWLAIGLLIDLALILWARHCLQRNFRHVAVQTADTGWRAFVRHLARGTDAPPATQTEAKS
jgi:hypothetical protein